MAASAHTAQVGFHSRFHPIVNEHTRARRVGRARHPHGIHAARRPVLAHGRGRTRTQLVALGSRPGRRRRASRALDPRRRHRVLAVRPRRAGLGQNAGGVRLRRRGRRRGHGRAHLGRRRAPSSASSTASGVARSVASRSSSRALPSRPPPTSSWAPPRTAIWCSAPTPRPNVPTSTRCESNTSPRSGSPAVTSSSTPIPPTATGCGASGEGGPASPGFDDALRAHELVDAAYRSASAADDRLGVTLVEAARPASTRAA